MTDDAYIRKFIAFNKHATERYLTFSNHNTTSRKKEILEAYERLGLLYRTPDEVSASALHWYITDIGWDLIKLANI